MQSEALAQTVSAVQCSLPPPHSCVLVHSLPFQVSTLCWCECSVTHKVRLAHDTDTGLVGAGIFSHLLPFHRKAGAFLIPLRKSTEPKARQYHVAEHDTVARPAPAGVATSRQDAPFQIS